MKRDPLRALALRDGRFSPEAFRFLFESLDRAVQLAGKHDREGTERHVTGQEVLAGMIDYGRETFGPLAAAVWRSWGVHRPLDWGHIVFLLVDEELLKRQEEDTIDDFRSDVDFERTFVDGYQPPVATLGDATATVRPTDTGEE